MRNDPRQSEYADEVRTIVRHEASMSLSDRELKHRLRGFGFSLRLTDSGPVVTSRMSGGAVCMLHVADELSANGRHTTESRRLA